MEVSKERDIAIYVPQEVRNVIIARQEVILNPLKAVDERFPYIFLY
jgi:hypothetical protein